MDTMTIDQKESIYSLTDQIECLLDHCNVMSARHNYLIDRLLRFDIMKSRGENLYALDVLRAAIGNAKSYSTSSTL